MTTETLPRSTCYPRDDTLLNVDDALAQVRMQIQPLHTQEHVALGAALGRVCAEDIHAPIDLPGADNSAMDGYAVHHADIAPHGVTTLPIAQRIAAGTLPAPLARGTAARIFTGAWMPSGADTVVIQEKVSEHAGQAHFTGPLRAREFVRSRGEDIQRGACAIARGTRLDATHIALLAALGIAQLVVRPVIRVAIITTGSELAEPGAPLAPGQIYNANAALLQALCRQAGAEVTRIATVRDDLNTTVSMLRECASECDLLLTTGGASVGEEDHLKAALECCGRIALWRIALKPGKPLVFGHINNVPVLGLPGNPVSAYVTFLLFGYAAIGHMAGTPPAARGIYLPAAFEWHKANPRREYARARLRHIDCTTQIELYPDQNSHVISSLTWADGLVVIPENKVVHLGEAVEFLFLPKLN